MKYFYLILWGGHIHEVPYEEKRYKEALRLWNSGGQLVIQNRNTNVPIGVAGSEVKEIYDEQAYASWCKTAKIKRYIKDGIWRDSKEHGIVEIEPWKQKEIDKVKKIAAQKEKQEYIDPAVAKKRMVQMRADLVKRGVLPKNK